MANVEAFLPGDTERTSAKKRRQEAYKRDLQIQMKDQDAARKRERFQGMSVNASGWLDPEKGPERLKPLGGAGFMTDRTNRDSKVRPYHSLFNYDKLPKNAVTMYEAPGGRPASAHVPSLRAHAMAPAPKVEPLNLDPPAGLTIQPLHMAPTNHAPYPTSTQDAYNFYATRDLDRPAAQYGSIIQPLSIPYVDNRPIIMPGRYDYPSGASRASMRARGASQWCERLHSQSYSDKTRDNRQRYNPFQNYDGVFKDIKNLLAGSQLENERLKNQRLRENDDNQKRMRKELEDERRRLMDQEMDARRRIEELRREAEERRREWERRLREAELARNKKEPVKTDVVVVRPSSSHLLADMEEMRRRMADERRKIEELLKLQWKVPDYTEVKVLKRPPPPPTPIDVDRADAINLNEFEYLKNKDVETRHNFRRLYPDHPHTNKRLENQQVALLRQQEDALNKLSYRKPPPGLILVEKGFKRPAWLDKSPTPFPHRLRQRDRLYTTQSLGADLDRMYKTNERRERNVEAQGDGFDSFRFRSHRPSSTETLADDTWLRSSSVQTL